MPIPSDARRAEGAKDAQPDPEPDPLPLYEPPPPGGGRRPPRRWRFTDWALI